MDVLRSLIFTPGQRQPMVDRAFDLDADAVIFDLEDGVPVAKKDAAREQVASALRRPRRAGGPALFVRVNASATGRREGDIASVVCPGLDGLVLPKVEHRDELAAVDRILALVEKAAHVEEGATKIVAMIESARGLLAAAEIAAGPRVIALMFGAEDLAADLGLPGSRTAGGHDFGYARAHVVVAAAAAGVHAIDQVWMDFRDADSLRRDALDGRRRGFTGKMAIHPDQLAVINEVFAPTDEEVAEAREIVAAAREAEARGIGFTVVGDRVVEPPIVQRAEAVLRRREAIAARG